MVKRLRFTRIGVSWLVRKRAVHVRRGCIHCDTIFRVYFTAKLLTAIYHSRNCYMARRTAGRTWSVRLPLQTCNSRVSFVVQFYSKSCAPISWVLSARCHCPSGWSSCSEFESRHVANGGIGVAREMFWGGPTWLIKNFKAKIKVRGLFNL